MVKSTSQPPIVKPHAAIAVVGASARAAAFSLLRVGYRVVATDLFADADLASRCEVTRVTPYPDGFEAWLAKTDCDGWLYTGALENYPKLVDRLANLRPLIGNAGEVLRRVRDPLMLQSALKDAGLSFPETVWNGRATNLFDTPKAPSPDPSPDDGGGEYERGAKPQNEWIGKSYRGSCGSGVGLNDDSPYWQRFVEGVSLSAVFQGQQLLGVTRQLVGEDWTGAKQFQYCGTIAPWPLPEDKIKQLQTLGQVLRDEFQLTGLYGVDLIDDGERLWTIEVNPRYTAAVEVIERAYEFSAFDQKHGGFGGTPPKIATHLGGSPPNPPVSLDSASSRAEVSTKTASFGKVIIFAKHSLTITAELSEKFLRQADNTAWPEIADIPNPDTDIAVGQPVLTVFASGESCEAVEKNLRQRVIEIEKRLYQEAMPCG